MTKPKPDRSRARDIARWVLGLAAIVFGVATVISGGRMLFGEDAVQIHVGEVVEFVLVFNFSAGFVYVAGGLATIMERRSSIIIARLLAGATIVVFAMFGAYVIAGRPFETQTFVAMTIRSLFWLGQAAALPYICKQIAHEVPRLS